MGYLADRDTADAVFEVIQGTLKIVHEALSALCVYFRLVVQVHIINLTG